MCHSVTHRDTLARSARDTVVDGISALKSCEKGSETDAKVFHMTRTPYFFKWEMSYLFSLSKRVGNGYDHNDWQT